MAKQKFVITQEGKYIQGKVDFHSDLDKKSQSGGRWFYHQEENTVYLYGVSSDFGPFLNEQINDQDLKHIYGEDVKIRKHELTLKLKDVLGLYMSDRKAMKLISRNKFI